MGRSEKERIHIRLYDYQIEYLREQGYNISAKLRKEADNIIIEDGEDPDIVAEEHRAQSR